MLKTRAVCFLLAFAGLLPSGAEAASCKLVNAYESGKVKVWLSDDKLVTYTTNVDVNTDGALSSYRADDLGAWDAVDKRIETREALNTICNGVSIRNKNDKLVFDYRKCGSLVKEFERIRAFGWIKPGENYVDFYAIGRSKPEAKGRNRGVPCEVKGYYVSMTAKPIDRSKPVCDPERWVDSLRIPAIVMPLDAKMKAAGVGLHDLAVVRIPDSGRWIGAIVGDTNPSKIGEGTVNLNRRLKNKTADPKNYQEVLSFVVKKAEYVVFPGSAATLGRFGNNDDALIQKEAGKLFTKHALSTREPVCAP